MEKSSAMALTNDMETTILEVEFSGESVSNIIIFYWLDTLVNFLKCIGLLH